MISNILEQFTVSKDMFSLTVQLIKDNVKVFQVNQSNWEYATQVYYGKSLPNLSKRKFQSPKEFFSYLYQYSQRRDIWIFNELGTVSLSTDQLEILYLNLKKASDAPQINKFILSQLSTLRGDFRASASDFNDLKIDTKATHGQIAQKLKGIGQIVIRIDNQLANQAKMRKIIEGEVQRMKESINSQIIPKFNELQLKIKDQDKSHKTDFDNIHKTIVRNTQTLKQQFDIKMVQISSRLNEFITSLSPFDFHKMEKDIQTINKSFEQEIKIKQYRFEIDDAVISKHKKLYLINKTILKNMEDDKDYHKVISKAPLPKCRSKFRIHVRNIKNNGLLIGICTTKLKTCFQTAPFNDFSMVTFNSCGYLTVKGVMHMTPFRINSGDIVKVVVDIFKSEIFWWINDVGMISADLGSMAKQDLYAVVGLGYFGDQIEILDLVEQVKVVDNSITESYSKQLQKVNAKYARDYQIKYK